MFEEIVYISDYDHNNESTLLLNFRDYDILSFLTDTKLASHDLKI